jgi:hypothetical protein
MSEDITWYLALITSEHNQQPNYMAMVAALVQPLNDVGELEQHFYQYYDLDLAEGAQLDAIGEWVGRTRYLPVPISGYFSLDAEGLGLDEAPWQRPFDPVTGLVALDDDSYRILLRSVILANHWDGTIPGAYAAYQQLFAGTGYTFAIQDFGDSSMGFVLLSKTPPDTITQGLFQEGELDLKPAGIELWHILPSQYPAGPGGTPLFGLDSATGSVAGLDLGAWALFSQPE